MPGRWQGGHDASRRGVRPQWSNRRPGASPNTAVETEEVGLHPCRAEIEELVHVGQRVIAQCETEANILAQAEDPDPTTAAPPQAPAEEAATSSDSAVEIKDICEATASEATPAAKEQFLAWCAAEIRASGAESASEPPGPETGMRTPTEVVIGVICEVVIGVGPSLRHGARWID